MKNNFVDYAPFYDLFNAGKDYAGESLYVDSLIKRFKPNARKILDIGCGTGLHAIELSKKNYNVTGVDTSKEMIEIALKNSEDLNFFLDLDQSFNSNEKFDAIISLFHVTSYQTDEVKLTDFFNLASRNLKPGGIFILDYWFSPAVQFLKLQERVKEIIFNGKSIQKKSKPTIISPNLFNIDITISAENFIITESHLMKSFIPGDFSQIIDFKLIQSFGWLTHDNPTLTNWTAVSILKKI